MASSHLMAILMVREHRNGVFITKKLPVLVNFDLAAAVFHRI